MGTFEPDAKPAYRCRPWVRRAGLSIVLVAAGMTALLVVFVVVRPSAAFGWAREPFVWVYIGTLWLGGVKVLAGTRRPIAELLDDRLVLRPLHQLRGTTIPWPSVLGTEQMTGGDRLIVYHQTARGMRFVALNLNLVKGRREFLAALDARLRAMGFRERIVERSRYLSRRKDEGERMKDEG
ncbi:MAG TPA: hypothetical protein VM779_09170 [Thermoanaerobaculia bacterium]|nr:hypothetical protein [Thermoanaerobaculia bacterium]